MLDEIKCGILCNFVKAPQAVVTIFLPPLFFAVLSYDYAKKSRGNTAGFEMLFTFCRRR